MARARAPSRPHEAGRKPLFSNALKNKARRTRAWPGMTREFFASRPVSRVLYGPGPLAGCRNVAAIHLGRRSRVASRNPPGQRARKQACDVLAHAPCRPYSVLLPVGFTMPSPLPGPRWALTPPFHPYAANVPQAGTSARSTLCGTFPGVAPAGRYPAPCFRGARTFLTSPPFGIGEARLPGRLAGA